MISMFDRRHQYVLAEATKTISLQKDEIHEEEDNLWVGSTSFSRCNAPCEFAAGLKIPPEAEGQQLRAGRGDVVIFPDLAAHSIYGNSPMVLEKPSSRFYAGVPIISPKGYNIGVYCIFDDVPRAGLSDTQVEFMKDMVSKNARSLSLISKTDIPGSHHHGSPRDDSRQIRTSP